MKELFTAYIAAALPCVIGFIAGVLVGLLL